MSFPVSASNCFFCVFLWYLCLSRGLPSAFSPEKTERLLGQAGNREEVGQCHSHPTE